MTNPIIPFTFIPGTKAKAEEVNQNFTSLAEKIENVETDSTNKLKQATNTFETKFEDLNTQYSDINLSNSGVISNCILEAPNGIAEYENSRITIKSGLKLLIPNGRDENLKFKNITHCLPIDLNVSVTDFGDSERVLFVTNSNTCIATLAQYYFIQNTEPDNPDSTNYIWFNPKSNTLKQYNVATEKWDILLATEIGTVTSKSELVEEIKTHSPFSILKQTDKKEVCRWSMPSNKYVDFPLGASGSTYVAPGNGWVTVQLKATAARQYMQLHSITIPVFGLESHSVGTGDTVKLTIPVRKNDIICLNYSFGTTGNTFRFFYAEGEKEE